MLDYGWWTQLQSHFAEGFKDEGDEAQKNSRDHLIAETKEFEKKITELRKAQ